MDKKVRFVLFAIAVCLLVSGLFLVFMRHNDEKSALWLAASQQQGADHKARLRLDYALAHNPYSPHLWQLVHHKPYADKGSAADEKASVIGRLLNPQTAYAAEGENP